MLGQLKRAVDVQASLGHENCAVVRFGLGRIVGYMVNNHRGFLLAYAFDYVADKLLRIVSEHQRGRAYAFENSHHRPPCKPCSAGYLAHYIVGHRRGAHVAEVARACADSTELHCIVGVLFAGNHDIFQFRHREIAPQVFNGLGYQFLTVVMHGVDILVVDLVP